VTAGDQPCFKGAPEGTHYNNFIRVVKKK